MNLHHDNVADNSIVLSRLKLERYHATFSQIYECIVLSYYEYPLKLFCVYNLYTTYFYSRKYTRARDRPLKYLNLTSLSEVLSELIKYIYRSD